MDCICILFIRGSQVYLRHEYIGIVSQFLSKHNISNEIVLSDSRGEDYTFFDTIEIRYNRSQCQVMDKFYSTMEKASVRRIDELVELLKELDFGIKFEKELE